MDLLPAIDLLEGGAVRLVQGGFDRVQTFGDPLEVARDFVTGGAEWIHVVDLDAARTGESRNRTSVLSVLELAHEAGVRVQVGGGVRSDRAVETLLDAGVDRVVLGTAAVEDPGFAARAARRHPGRVAVGIDYRRGRSGSLEAAVRGWTGATVGGVGGVLAALGDEPLGALVVTAIDRDGTLSGPDTEGLAAVLDATSLPVIASGGVSGADDLRALAGLRSPAHRRAPAGAVVGRALLDGTLPLAEALAACASSG
jgi:phosphoribosylformimino-5-aminoimidazole carboxamide ribotide isomerase